MVAMILQYVSYLLAAAFIYSLLGVALALGGDLPVSGLFIAMILCSISLGAVAAPISIYRPRVAGYIGLVLSGIFGIYAMAWPSLDLLWITFVTITFAALGTSAYSILATSVPIKRRYSTKPGKVAAFVAAALPAGVGAVLTISLITNIATHYSFAWSS